MGAALFDIEATVRENEDLSCTAKKCEWKRRQRNNKEGGIALKDINISKEEYGKDTNNIYPSCHYSKFDPRRNSIEDPSSRTNALFDIIQDTAPDAGILSYKPKHATSEISANEVYQHMTNDLNIHKTEEIESVDLLTVKKLADSFVKDRGLEAVTADDCEAFISYITLSEVQRSTLEHITKTQGNSTVWHDHRVGRITAPNVYRICHLKASTDPTNTIKHLTRNTLNAVAPRPYFYILILILLF